MKQILSLILALACGFGLAAQSFSDDFYDALNSDNVHQQRRILAKWAMTDPGDIDLYIARFNHYINLSMAQTGDPVLAASLADSGLTVIDRAISLFPERLDLRFGKIYFLGQIMRWQSFTDEVVRTLNRSEKTNHQWQFPNFDQGGRILIIEGVQDYLYTLNEATQNAGPEARKAILPHIRRIAHRAAQLFPSEPSFLSSLAYTYIAEADYETALHHLNRAEQLSPNDPAVLQQLVDVYTRMKNKKQAAQYRARLEKLQEP
ncbi:MAG: hypothetical protein IJ785_04515 [Bacteroidales bacterium]|nr:hypothetical protein [Bacteroidales bacterium]